MAEFRYKAFISYSWSDAAWGKWLHNALETYRTPRALIGKEGGLGPVPARLHPLFKDREEEAAGSSIGAAVEAALNNSEFLIVICSPRSAQSQWVNREVAWFKTHRDPAKVLALIVDGTPGSGDGTECFPAALTHEVRTDLSLAGALGDAPLAADARDSGDGKRNARLKLAAAMLGVGLDELVDRDNRRRALRQRWVTAGSLLFGGSMAALAWVAVQARDEADHQRAEADGLVEFMLTDLREKLEPVGRLDALDVVGQRALKYYAGQDPGSLDADALGRRSRALHLVGEVRNIRGDSGGGLTAFRQAAATTAELLARDPDNQQRIFDHAQSVFWVGYIAYERGEANAAEKEWREYKRLAERLVTLNPKKPEWRTEVSYAEANLGVLYFDQGRYGEAEPAFETGLNLLEQVASGSKWDATRQIEIGTAINWLGKAKSKLNRREQSLALHLREIAVYQGILRAEPTNTQAKMREAVAWQHVGQLEDSRGNLDAGSAAYATSISLMKQLRAIEPANTEWRETELRAQIAQISNMFYRQRLADARSMYQAAISSLTALRSADPKNRIWSIDLQSLLDNRAAQLALASGNLTGALSSANETIRRTEQVDGAEATSVHVEALVLAGDALNRLGRKAEAAEMWQNGLTRLSAVPRGFQSSQLRWQFNLHRRLGHAVEARQVAEQLDGQGDRHPAYLLDKQALR